MNSETRASTTSEASRANLAIRYDASDDSYVVTANGGSTRFASSTLASDEKGRRTFKISSGDRSETLVLQRGTRAQLPSYVQIGYLLRRSREGTSESIEYSPFAYGLASAANAVPRSGVAYYGADVVGLATRPGNEPLEMNGSGFFAIDFAQGIFSFESSSFARGLYSNFSSSGQSVDASGSLGSGGSFSGFAGYRGFYGEAEGTIEGRFYGPSAQELGATFVTSGPNGLKVTGSLLGVVNPSATTQNFRLTDLRNEQSFLALSDVSSSSAYTYKTPTSFSFGYMGENHFSWSDDQRVSQDGRFTTYRRSGPDPYGVDSTTTLKLFRVGSANSQIQLHYVSLGHWQRQYSDKTQDAFFHYGFRTPNFVNPVRTGYATYRGPVYGYGTRASGSSPSTTFYYDVSGSSVFNFNFSNMDWNGQLALNATQRGTTDAVVLPTLDIYAKTIRPSTVFGAFRNGPGEVRVTFYGPRGEELAADFYTIFPAGGPFPTDFTVNGATVAKPD